MTGWLGLLDVSALATVAVAFFVAAASPGPATLATAATAMAYGRRAALSFAAGLSVGLALWGLAAALGLGAALSHSVWAATALRILGGGYLLYLAWRSARSALRDASALSASRSEAASPSFATMAGRGFLLNATNPKAVLAWMAVLALGMPQDAGAPQLWGSFALCAALGVVIYAGYAIAFSTPPLRAGYVRARRGIDAAAAAVFGIAGARLLAGRAAEAP